MIENKMINELLKTHENIKPEIISRLDEFRNLWVNGSDEEIFKELIFCLLTPQSKAERCWECVKSLESRGLLFGENIEDMAEEMRNVRFRFNKAKYIFEARNKFTMNGELKIKEQIDKFQNIYNLRGWLVKNIKGMGYKEASHFLRNIGLGENLAILDRHILRNLKFLGLVNEIPKSLSRKNYFEIEKRMASFSEKINLPLSHLDFVLWYIETGRIFK